MLFILLAAAALAQDSECDVDRLDVIDCLFDKCDFDQDGFLTEIEALFVYQEVLPTFKRYEAYLLISPESAVEQCGGAGVSREHVKENVDVCLPECLGRSEIMENVCDVLPPVRENAIMVEKFKRFYLPGVRSSSEE